MLYADFAHSHVTSNKVFSVLVCIEQVDDFLIVICYWFQTEHVSGAGALNTLSAACLTHNALW